MRWRVRARRAYTSASMPLEISHHEIAPGTVVITLTGKLQMGPEGQVIVPLVESLLAGGARTIIFDLAGVPRIDSTGIGHFIASHNRTSAAGAQMRMAGATGHLERVFRVCMLDTVFRFYPTLEAASAA